MSKDITYQLEAGGHIQGTLTIPGDKSISHRSIMFGSLAEGTTQVHGFLEGEDSLATLRAFRQMGVKIEGPNKGEVTIQGVGMHGLKGSDQALDLGNSGTSIRLMSGLLAGQSFDSVLIGDESLSKRPMKRVTQPLASMGARIETTEKGTAPLTVRGNTPLKGIQYDMPMASAQVKSCLLLAGLYAEGETSVTEPGITRDHTERMLEAFGWPVKTEGNKISVTGGGSLKAIDLTVPADISSAAFFMVGAAISSNSEVRLTQVGINPTRTGVIDILKLMGAKITLENQQELGKEPVADIVIKSSQLKGIDIPEELVPLAIDEFPAIFIAAACAEGTTILTGAEELRVKESDRIQAMADGLIVLGVDATPTTDGIRIQGKGGFTSGTIDSYGDHRIAMSFAMASIRASGPIVIKDCENVNTSFPNFVGLAKNAGLRIEQIG
ncbi:MAG: 3-phosphoshikimate 1-carboxyvinyltransferase [Gammaproteobacteria bacterium]|nr:3-phosphoshikimate 1-carboxyvinyltransferase [Gammaproteobacteria bacterium]MDH5693229.1 3-phosphoshikimate 1-carboxyvinyltransferase [Gammaproteobacteria bacterium]